MIDKNKKYRIEKLYGYCELSQSFRMDGGKLISVGIKKDFSGEGLLESTTETDCCVMTFV